MERAVYCQTWLAGRPNCHPVAPMKHLGMIEELEKNHVTMLAWSIMGGGSVSLPVLEDIINGKVPFQLRFHGYMNEKEFNEECLRRGILPYAVIYQSQAWEFPARFNADKSELTEINILRPGDGYEWYGMREFTQNTYPKLFSKQFLDYFPEGLVNSDGEKVVDLYDECTARKPDKTPVHSLWVEVEGLSKTCHTPCRNNPVWRSYLKKLAEIVIDAGAKAIQLDECENPITTITRGGCFCKDCMKQFREYLKGLKKEGALPAELAAQDLDTFDYGDYISEKRINWPEGLMDIPFIREYWDFQVETQNKYFKEIIGYIRAYAKKEKGLDIKISGNFFNLHMLYRNSLNEVDVCVTENRRTVFRRHEWYRMAAGYTGGKELILAESPYDDFINKFVDFVRRGKGDDYYRVFVMEAAAHGINMAYPYGAWMGNKARDAFYAPKAAGLELQNFLKENDELFGKKSGANVLVLYDYRSNILRDYQSEQGECLVYDEADNLFSYRIKYDERSARVPYFEISKLLIDYRIPFDVCVLGDGRLDPDTFSSDTLAGYDIVIAPDVGFLTKNQSGLLRSFAAGKSLFIYGSYGENLAGESAAAEKAGAKIYRADTQDRCRALAESSVGDFCRALNKCYEKYRIIDWDNNDIYIQQTVKEKKTVLHLLNYAFDSSSCQSVPQTVIVKIKREGAIKGMTLDSSPLRIERLRPASEGFITLKITGLPCYGTVVLEDL
jgi:hypothetical protein